MIQHNAEKTSFLALQINTIHHTVYIVMLHAVFQLKQHPSCIKNSFCCKPITSIGLYNMIKFKNGQI